MQSFFVVIYNVLDVIVYNREDATGAVSRKSLTSCMID